MIASCFEVLGGPRHEPLFFIGFDIPKAEDDFAGQPYVLWSCTEDAPALQCFG